MFENTFFKLNNLFSNIFDKKAINEFQNAIFDIFLEADVPYNYTKKLVDKINSQIDCVKIDNKKKIEIIGFLLKKHILNTFKKSIKPLELKYNKTNIIGVFGLNGVGKTSFIAKFANYLRKNYYKSIACVSFDNQRPTGKEQLKELCSQIGVKYLTFKDVKHGLQMINTVAKNNLVDVLLVDTAGLNPKNKTNIDNLLAVIKYISFDERILVMDGTLGQNAVETITLFRKNIKPTGVVVSKTETDKKGGVFFSIRTAVGVPIYFITKGEKIGDICVFNEKFINNCLFGDYGFGEFLSKQPKTQQMCEQNLVKTTQRLCIDYNFLQQKLIKLVQKDVFSQFKSVVFGCNSFVGVKMTTESYVLIKKWIAIINSMTKNERLGLCGLSICRLNRIAKGAGVTPADVIVLKNKFMEMNNAH